MEGFDLRIGRSGIQERLRELIPSVTDGCQGDTTLDAAKLARILFCADFASFARYGEPITGAPYKKEEGSSLDRVG